MDTDYFSCPICQNMLPLKTTRNKKPYSICNECGVQLFVRGKKGIRRLAVLLGNLKVKENTITGRYASYYLEFLENKLEKMRQKTLMLGKGTDPEHQRSTIEHQIRKLHNAIKQDDFTDG